MPRYLIIPWLFLCFVGCDQRSDDSAESQEVARAGSSHRRGMPATDQPMQASSKSLRALLDEAETYEDIEREKALAAMAWEAIETDPETAHRAFASLSPASQEKRRLIQHYAMRLAEEDVDQAIAWAISLTNEKETSSALTHIAVALAEADPQRSASLLVEHGQPGHELDIAVVQVVQRWSARSTTDAAEWVSRFPSGDARQASVKVIVERWLPQDATAAFAWMVSMNDAGLRQETARAMEGVILQQPEETRSAWLREASESLQQELEQQREFALKDVAGHMPILISPKLK